MTANDIYNDAIKALIAISAPIALTIDGTLLHGLSAGVCQELADLNPESLVLVINGVTVENDEVVFPATAKIKSRVVWHGNIRQWELPTLIQKARLVNMLFWKRRNAEDGHDD